MSRYLIFAFSDLYPEGGALSLVTDIEDVKKSLTDNYEKYYSECSNKVNVLDLKLMKSSRQYNLYYTRDIKGWEGNLDIDEIDDLIDELKSFEQDRE